MANANDIRVLFEQALRKHQAGHVGGAEKLYRRILDQQPSHRDSLHLLGVIRLGEKKYQDAIRLIEKSLGLGRDVAAICFNLARAYEENDELDKAVLMYERARLLDPRDADIDFGIGTVLSAKRNYLDAIAAFNRALALAPRHANAHNNKGIALKYLDRFEEALASYMAAIHIDARHTDAHLNRAALLETRYRLEEALEGYDHILSYEAHHATAWLQRGRNLSTQKRHAEAIASFQKTVELQPDNLEALAHLLIERCRISDWSNFEKSYSKLQRGLLKSNAMVQPISLARLFDEPALMLTAAREFSEGKSRVEREPFKVDALEKRKLKIGYFSSDLHAKHPVFQALAGTFAHHDRSRFEIHFFLLPQTTPQPIPELLVQFGDTIHELSNLNDSEMRAKITTVNLDIAVDLNGFTKMHRVDLFRSGIAPLHVNYLGSPGSMGSSAHDYIIADSTLIPETAFDQFSESVAWMPNSFFPVNNTRPLANDIPTRVAAGLLAEGFVFGYFGRADRILPVVFERWIKIVKSVEGSVLWLKDPENLARENLKLEAKKMGLASDRLIFAKRTESNADHLARLTLMDLCLDTLPYNAHMTALDCLFAGVPVLTLQGKSFAARVASSLLHACGLPDLVCTNAENFETTAIRIATEPAQFATLKNKLLEARQTSALFDTALYTRNLEKAFMIMALRNAQGLPPHHFGVT